MKIGLIILCRFNSSRLPGKILMKLAGKPLLQYILERMDEVVGKDEVIVATSDEPSDDPIADFCSKNKVKCFRGSLEDVSGRFLACAKTYQLDFAIRINGDNLFADHQLISQMIERARSGNYDFLTNVKNRTYPTGMSVEIVSVKFYEDMCKNFLNKELKEHVTLYFYQNPESIPKPYYQYNKKLPEAAGMKLAVDSKEDFTFAVNLLAKMKEEHISYGLEEILHLIASKK